MEVVDTNVVNVAQGLATHADAACVDACQLRLTSIITHREICIDELDLILESYIAQVGHSPRPGMGRAFVRWVRDTRFNNPRVHRVPVTPRHGDWRRFEEFPDRADLVKFDGADHVFVAVAMGSGTAHPPQITNAVDSDWADHHQALAAAGVQIEFLCPQHCKP